MKKICGGKRLAMKIKIIFSIMCGERNLINSYLNKGLEPLVQTYSYFHPSYNWHTYAKYFSIFFLAIALILIHPLNSRERQPVRTFFSLGPHSPFSDGQVVKISHSGNLVVHIGYGKWLPGTNRVNRYNKIFNLRTKEVIGSFYITPEPKILFVTFDSTDSNLLLAVRQGELAFLYRYNISENILEWDTISSSTVLNYSISQNCRFASLLTQNEGILVWDFEQKKYIAQFPTDSNYTYYYHTFTLDSRYIAIIQNKRYLLWDFLNDSIIKSYNYYSYSTKLQLTPDNTKAIIWNPQEILVFDFTSGKYLCGFDFSPVNILFRKDSKMIYISNLATTTGVIDLEHCTMKRVLAISNIDYYYDSDREFILSVGDGTSLLDPDSLTQLEILSPIRDLSTFLPIRKKTLYFNKTFYRLSKGDEVFPSIFKIEGDSLTYLWDIPTDYRRIIPPLYYWDWADTSTIRVSEMYSQKTFKEINIENVKRTVPFYKDYYLKFAPLFNYLLYVDCIGTSTTSKVAIVKIYDVRENTKMLREHILLKDTSFVPDHQCSTNIAEFLCNNNAYYIKLAKRDPTDSSIIYTIQFYRTSNGELLSSVTSHVNPIISSGGDCYVWIAPASNESHILYDFCSNTSKILTSIPKGYISFDSVFFWTHDVLVIVGNHKNGYLFSIIDFKKDILLDSFFFNNRYGNYVTRVVPSPFEPAIYFGCSNGTFGWYDLSDVIDTTQLGVDTNALQYNKFSFAYEYGNLQITAAREVIVSIQLFNILGQSVTSMSEVRLLTGKNAIELPREKLTPGIYLIKIIIGDSFLIDKIVIP